MTSNNNLKPFHHVKVSQENKADLLVWKSFLQNPQVFCRPFMDVIQISSTDIGMFSDASRNFELGYGAVCGEEWIYGQWDKNFMNEAEPSIEYLELFAVAVAVLKWIKWFKNKCIYLHCDNESVVYMINKMSSSCKNCMVLLRLIVLEGLLQNVQISAVHVKSEDNGQADALSRLDIQRFFRLSKGMNINEKASEIPVELWPINKIWLR